MAQNESRLREAEKQIKIVSDTIESRDALDRLEQARAIIQEVREAENQPVEQI